MKLVYDLSRMGRPGVHASPGDEVVASFIQSSLRDVDDVEWTRRWIMKELASPSDDSLGFDGYVLEVADSDVVICSLYDQFPDSPYSSEEFLGALADYEAWLRSVAQERG